MNLLFRLSAFSSLLLLASTTYAQVTMRTNTLSLVNGSNELSLIYSGTGTATLTIPSSSSMTVLAGSSAGEMLRWDGTQWIATANVLNDGTNITLPSANLTLTSGILTGNGSGLTTINASNISSGALNIARISSSGASANDVLMFDGTNLVWDLPPSSALSLPFSQSDNNASPLLSITNTGVGYAISGTSTSYGIHGSGSTGVYGYGTSTGVYGYGTSTGVYALSTSGVGVLGFSEDGFGVNGMSGSSVAGFFQIAEFGNNSNVVEAWTSNSGTALYGVSQGGQGVHGISTSGAGVTGSSTSGAGGVFSGSPGLQIQSGGLVGSVGSVNDNGTMPANVVIVVVNDNGNVDPSQHVPRINTPATGQQGQIMIVYSDDPDGAIIDSSYSVDGYQHITLVYIAGYWHPPSGS